MSRERTSRRHVKCRRAVILIVGLDAVDEREVVDVLRDMRKEIRDVATRLTVLLKPERASHTLVRKGQSTLKLALESPECRDALAVKLVESRLVIERVDVTHATLHEKKYAVLRLAPEMRRTNRERIGRRRDARVLREQVLREEPAERERADAVVRPIEKLSSLERHEVHL